MLNQIRVHTRTNSTSSKVLHFVSWSRVLFTVFHCRTSNWNSIGFVWVKRWPLEPVMSLTTTTKSCRVVFGVCLTKHIAPRRKQSRLFDGANAKHTVKQRSKWGEAFCVSCLLGYECAAGSRKGKKHTEHGKGLTRTPHGALRKVLSTDSTQSIR